MKSCSLGAHSAQWNDTWEPTYAETGATRKIALYIDGPVYGDKIYRASALTSPWVLHREQADDLPPN